jgi:uncharacterized protein
VKTKAIGMLAGVVFGFTLAWARLTDPHVIREMLLLKEAHVFLIMGSAVVMGAAGTQLLKMLDARTIVTHEPISFRREHPEARHITGSVLFATGWTVAGTCPGRVAAMVGQGQLLGLPVAAGLFTGVMLQRVIARTAKVESQTPAPSTAGL